MTFRPSGWTRWSAGTVAAGAIAVMAGAAIGARPESVPASCRVTLPSREAFTPPAPYPSQPPFRNVGWVGTPALWTLAPADGVYRGLRVAAGYREKLFWWHPGYDGRAEPHPTLTLTVRRLDGPAEPLLVRDATSAYTSEFGGWAMLVMPDIPDAGCWRLTGSYRNASFSYVVWVDGPTQR